MAKKFEEYSEKELTQILLVMSLITAGKSKLGVIEHLRKFKPEMTRSEISKLYTKTLQFLRDNSEEYVEKMRDVNVERLTMLYEEAVKEGKTKLAAEILDTMNKTCGIYQTKLEIKGDTKFRFVFDGDGDEGETDKETQDEELQ